MARFDTIITGGTLIVPFVGEVRADIGIRYGKIAAIADEIAPSDSDDGIDARGKAVFPGGVDSHYHLGIYRDLAADTESETTSSLVGGVTTVVSYFRTGSHYLGKTGPYKEIFPEVLATVDGHAKVDYGFHLAPMTAEHVREIPWLIEQGVTSFKYYMFYKGLNLSADSRDARAYTMAEEYDLGHLYEIMEAVARAQVSSDVRLSVSLHCEQAELLRIFIERAKADPSIGGLAEYAAARPPLTERLSIEEAGVLADATGVNVNFLHLSSEIAARTAADVRARYPLMNANLETTVHHLALAHESLSGLGGKVNPPIRTREDNEALWRALSRGSIGTVASDHACCMEESKGDDLWPALPGFGGTALLYPVLISEGYHKRGVSLDRIAQVVSATPAGVFNLAPRKGTIAVGSDADLAVVDVNLTQTVTPELCRSAQDHSPFSGVSVTGWPVATLVRGVPMLRDGEVSKDWPGTYIKRNARATT
ncbi:MAG: dihydroorotase family protein [Actinomycetota bacterium]|nr:dihydroorotase family protein [Actinomycetota bacterium]